jgi:adenine-specific DNA-methyltransferase
MAKIEDLVAQIPDERLKKAVGAEVRELKRNKKFGLVFEEHLPETVRLPKLPVKEGELVAKKRDSGNDLWRVKTIRKGIATLERAVEGYPLLSEIGIEVPLAELVVVRSFGDPIYPALVPVDRVARGGPDKPWHMLINADNFHALQLLLYAYEGKVDVIYIDPPYNTGARDWKYNNDYVDQNDPWRHSKWLSMMQKRLKLAKRLLNPLDAVLIVTIDEREYQHLALLLEQLFPEARIQMVSSVIKPEGTNRMGEFSRTNEFLYFVMLGAARVIPSSDDMTGRDREGDSNRIEWRNLRRRENTSIRTARPNQFYAVFVDPVKGRIHSVGDSLAPDIDKATVSIPKGCYACFPLKPDGTEMLWGLIPAALRTLLKEGFARVSKASLGPGKAAIQYLASGTVRAIASGEVQISGRDDQGAVQGAFEEVSIMPKTTWNKESHNAQASGTLIVSLLIPGRNFPFPKSLYAVEDALRFFIQNKPNALILDFFGGSGTTTHAVARLNRQDGGRRRSILITNNEVSADEAQELQRKGLEPRDAEWESLGICEHITWPRIAAAFTGVTPEGEPVCGEYRFTDEFPMAEGFDENIEFFRLDFLDPDEVARGDAFKAIVPIMWMVAGCRGEREESKGSTPWFIPKHSPFAVLIQEKQFRDFREKLAERKDIEWVFLITDSEENFGQMRRTLGRKYQCVQLYKSYLENFRINTQDALNG